jgi:GNAT superfamily N-acetyltransferase
MRRLNCWGDPRGGVRDAAVSDRRELRPNACWSALASDGEAAQAVITVSTVLYVEWGRLGEIGDRYVLPEHRRKGLARRLVEHAKAWCRAQGCSAVSVTITAAGERRHGAHGCHALMALRLTASRPTRIHFRRVNGRDLRIIRKGQHNPVKKQTGRCRSKVPKCLHSDGAHYVQCPLAGR